MKLIIIALISVVSAANISACSNSTDNTVNVLPYLSERDTTVADVSDTAGSGCDCVVVDSWYRFDMLEITSIGGEPHPVIGTLNLLWGSDIEQGELSILLRVTDVTATTITMDAINGAKIHGDPDGALCAQMNTAAEFVFPRNGCELQLTNEAAFNVYGGTTRNPKLCASTLPVKHAVPVGRAQLSGVLDDTCDRIESGNVPMGVFGQVELGQVCNCLVLPGDPASNCGDLDPDFVNGDGECGGCNANFSNLRALLEQFGDVQWTCKTEDDRTAACVTANFAAALLPSAPVDCATIAN